MSKYPDYKNDPDYEWKFIFKRTQEFIREIVAVTQEGWSVVYPVQDSFGSMQANVYRKKPVQEISKDLGEEKGGLDKKPENVNTPNLGEVKEEEKIPNENTSPEPNPNPNPESKVEEKGKTSQRNTKAKSK